MEEKKATPNRKVGIRPFNANNCAQVLLLSECMKLGRKKKPLSATLSCMYAYSTTHKQALALNGRIPTLRFGVAFVSSIGGCRFAITASEHR